jgi:hypothetical protein
MGLILHLMISEWILLKFTIPFIQVVFLNKSGFKSLLLFLKHDEGFDCPCFPGGFLFGREPTQSQ